MKPEGDYAVYTEHGGMVAYNVSREHAEAIAKRITVGWATVATVGGRVVKTFGKGKKNPGGRMTKAQRKAAAARRGKQTRVSRALKGFLKQYNPALVKRTAGAKIRRNRGGTITIIPVKVAKRGRR